tara:strand:- start:8049 stop:8225 length:177 start_codon:yes stop_codon:yes gene_type:complete
MVNPKIKVLKIVKKAFEVGGFLTVENMVNISIMKPKSIPIITELTLRIDHTLAKFKPK